VSVVQTISVYVLIPAAIYAVIALLSMASKRNRTPRYKPGQAWSYDPVWWSAHAAQSMQSVQQRAAVHGAPQPAAVAAVPASSVATDTARGGARGNW
jgi:hypothetical protein